MSMRPRLGAAAMMSVISTPSLSATSSTSIPRASSTATHPTVQPCPDKRHKVVIEEIPDKDTQLPTTSASPPLNSTRQESPDPTLTTSRKRVHLRRYKGLYVEEFLDSLAGEPISNDCLPPRNLDTYMRSCGSMANPEDFEVAELLMTSGLTNADKDRHLKSNKVSILFNAASRQEAK
jgi:hypothetical protein